MGSAIGRRNGVAIPAVAAVGPNRPGDRPFDAALLVRKILTAGKEIRGDAFAPGQLFAQMIGQTTGELECCFRRNIIAGLTLVAFPADFYTGVEIGLGTRQFEQSRCLEQITLAENFDIGDEGYAGTAAVGRCANFLEFGSR